MNGSRLRRRVEVARLLDDVEEGAVHLSQQLKDATKAQ
jgi:hypothetical protein